MEISQTTKGSHDAERVYCNIMDEDDTDFKYTKQKRAERRNEGQE